MVIRCGQWNINAKSPHKTLTENSNDNFTLASKEQSECLAVEESAADMSSCMVSDEKGNTDVATVNVTSYFNRTYQPYALDVERSRAMIGKWSSFTQASGSNSGNETILYFDNKLQSHTEPIRIRSFIDADLTDSQMICTSGIAVSHDANGTNDVNILLLIGEAAVSADVAKITEEGIEVKTWNVPDNDSDPDISDKPTDERIDATSIPEVVTDKENGSSTADQNGQFESPIIGELIIGICGQPLADDSSETDTGEIPLGSINVDEEQTAVDDIKATDENIEIMLRTGPGNDRTLDISDEGTNEVSDTTETLGSFIDRGDDNTLTSAYLLMTVMSCLLTKQFWFF